MDSDAILAEFTIPTPCLMNWDRMAGDDRVRFCDRCGTHVYDLTAMSPDERDAVTSQVLNDGEDLCGRLFQRPDGTLVASACPRPPGSIVVPRQFTIRSLMVAVAAWATVLGIVRLWMARPDPPSPAPRPGNPGRFRMGKMAPRRPGPSTIGGASCPPAASPGPDATG